jgi:dipeptidyl aminopeptidase/acylaminoacyl peptidase
MRTPSQPLSILTPIAASILFLLSFPISPHASESNNRLTPLHVAQLRTVTSAVIAPHGTTIAYTLAVPRRPFIEDDGRAWQELHVVSPDGRSRPFVSGKVNVSDIQWRPDGLAVSFRAKRADDKETALYAIPIHGGEARRLLSHESGVGAYSWSPDGQQIAFLATEPEPKDLKKQKEKGFNATIYEEDWLPVHVLIAQRLGPDDPWSDPSTNEKPRALDLQGSAFDLAWDPTGTHLAVAMAPTPLIDDSLIGQHVYLVDVTTGNVTGRVETTGKIGAFSWSPDGRHLALIAAEDQHDPREGRLVVVPRTGGPVLNLIPNHEGHIWSFAWQNNDTLVYLAEEGLAQTLASVAIDGTRLHTLLPAGSNVLSHLSFNREGPHGAVIGQSPQHPEEVFSFSLPDPQPRRLTDHNPWLADIQLAHQEPIRYHARDGLELQGVLIHPLNAPAGQPHPLIVYVHGGPEAHEANGWKTSYARPGQLAAARGFAVFYPNYRGSTGRGVEFSKLGQADYAGKEFDDIIDGVRHLVDSGLVDENRVGVTGGSYGGYATAWCATYYSQHFAAGVMFVGVSDLISKFGTTDIPREMHLVHARKQPWDDWDFFLDRSPVKHAGQSRTPLLILHGKDDPRVHPAQSLELYRYLKTWTDTPVRLVLYPGEGHGNARASSRLDYSLRMLQWFERYLLDDDAELPPHALDYPGQDVPDSDPD